MTPQTRTPFRNSESNPICDGLKKIGTTQDVGLFAISERRIVLPVNMKINYSTCVTLRTDETQEASADALVPNMVMVNSATELAALHVRDQVRFVLLELWCCWWRCCCCCCC